VRANRRGIDSMVGVQTISQTNSKKLVEYWSQSYDFLIFSYNASVVVG
jgi:hypothetical protein